MVNTPYQYNDETAQRAVEEARGIAMFGPKEETPEAAAARKTRATQRQAESATFQAKAARLQDAFGEHVEGTPYEERFAGVSMRHETLAEKTRKAEVQAAAFRAGIGQVLTPDEIRTRSLETVARIPEKQEAHRTAARERGAAYRATQTALEARSAHPQVARAGDTIATDLSKNAVSPERTNENPTQVAIRNFLATEAAKEAIVEAVGTRTVEPEVIKVITEELVKSAGQGTDRLRRILKGERFEKLRASLRTAWRQEYGQAA